MASSPKQTAKKASEIRVTATRTKMRTRKFRA
jgi:hypothetical protein